MVGWTSRGVEYEADPRQAEKLITDTQLQGAISVTTPGVKPLAHQLEEEKAISMSELFGFADRPLAANTLGLTGQTAFMQPRKSAGGCPPPLTYTRRRLNVWSGTCVAARAWCSSLSTKQQAI